MNLTFLIDMNLSPAWVETFIEHGWSAVHWSTVGDPRANDATVMEYARSGAYVVFTHDLDFGTILALTRAKGPSVIQVRAQDVSPDHLAPLLTTAIRENEQALARGALITIDESTARARILPLLP